MREERNNGLARQCRWSNAHNSFKAESFTLEDFANVHVYVRPHSFELGEIEFNLK